MTIDLDALESRLHQYDYTRGDVRALIEEVRRLREPFVPRVILGDMQVDGVDVASVVNGRLMVMPPTVPDVTDAMADRAANVFWPGSYVFMSGPARDSMRARARGALESALEGEA